MDTLRSSWERQWVTSSSGACGSPRLQFQPRSEPVEDVVLQVVEIVSPDNLHPVTKWQVKYSQNLFQVKPTSMACGAVMHFQSELQTSTMCIHLNDVNHAGSMKTH